VSRPLSARRAPTRGLGDGILTFTFFLAQSLSVFDPVALRRHCGPQVSCGSSARTTMCELDQRRRAWPTSKLFVSGLSGSSYIAPLRHVTACSTRCTARLSHSSMCCCPSSLCRRCNLCLVHVCAIGKACDTHGQLFVLDFDVSVQGPAFSRPSKLRLCLSRSRDKNQWPQDRLVLSQSRTLQRSPQVVSSVPRYDGTPLR
jgi:hypothetical protein